MYLLVTWTDDVSMSTMKVNSNLIMLAKYNFEILK